MGAAKANGFSGSKIIEDFVKNWLATVPTDAAQPLSSENPSDNVTSHAPTAQEQKYTQKLIRIMRSPFWTALQHNLDAFSKAVDLSEKLERLEASGKFSGDAASVEHQTLESDLEAEVVEDSRKTGPRPKHASKAESVPISGRKG